MPSPEWEDANAREEALRRKVVTENEAAAQSPERSVGFNRPAPQVGDVEEDEDMMDLLAPVTRRPPSISKLEIPAAEQRRLARESEMAWRKWNEEDVKANQHRWLNRYEIQASKFRDEWMADYSGYASFDDITEIKPMRFTDKPAPSNCWAMHCETVQVFSFKVSGIRGVLQWPLHVFGIVSVRDEIDQKRNIIFHRERDDSQTLTEEDPYLVLTGPTRAVVMVELVTFEVELKVKGATEFEDKDLSSLAVPIMHGCTLYPWLLSSSYTSKLSTMEIVVGHIVHSVEATIFVQVVDGSWAAGSWCQFVARSISSSWKNTDDIDGKEVILLDSRDEKVPSCVDDGIIDLSRCVVSVEVTGKLVVSVRAWDCDNILVGKETSTSKNTKRSYLQEEVIFTPKEADKSKATFDIGFCKIEVTVAWSLISEEIVAPF